MRTLRAILAEILGLFVDDGSLALALVLWCAGVGVAVIVVPGLPGPLAAAALLVGSVGILLVNVLRAARKRRSAASGG
jgi:Flp pilus assembly protein TadB